MIGKTELILYILWWIELPFILNYYNMTKEQFTKLLDTLEEVYAQDREDNTAWLDFIRVISPDSYAPIVEWKLSKALDVLKIEHPEITELMAYYFYEAKNMDKGGMIESDWKKYNYSIREDVIQSVIDFWYINTNV